MNTDSATPPSGPPPGPLPGSPPNPPLDPPPQYLRLGAEHELRPEDDFDVGGGGGRSFLRGLLVLMVLTIFGGSVWFAYEQGVRHGMQLAPPLIRSSTQPTKIKPADPGGMAVPHQDKGVYARITGERPAAEPERLNEADEADEAAEPQGTTTATATSTSDSEEEPATPLAEVRDADQPAAAPTSATSPPPEAPVPPVPAVPPLPQTAEVAKIEMPQDRAADMPPPPPPPAPPLPLADKPPIPLTPPAEAKEEAPEAPQAPQAAALAAQAEEATDPGKPAAPPGWRIQIAAFRSPATARSGWRRLVKLHGDLIGDLRPSVERVDLGSRGVFHRLQVGPLASAAAAQALCASLKERKAGCLVVRP